MSDTASIERRHLMKQFNATVQLFKATKGYSTGIEMSLEMAAANPHIFLTKQFENPLNALDHEQHTAKEIISQVGGPVDAFVSGYGTGGTLMGCSRGLRNKYPKMKTYAMEPAEAAMLSGECPCCHLIEGIAGGYVPPLLSNSEIDGVIKVKSLDAVAMTRRLTGEFGLLVGTSSGGNVAAALRMACELPEDAKVVTILCDRAERYYSTKLFA
jgi:cysteine synthase A